MRLLHYSAKPIEKLYPIAPESRRPDKPHGFWVSVEGEDDWFSWCQKEEFELDCLAFVHEVTLKPKANIRFITSAEEIFGLSRDFGVALSGLDPTRFIHGLDWVKIASKWQGIVIAPYQWDCRLDHKCSWYYGWDCASGCIWDINAIESIKVLDS